MDSVFDGCYRGRWVVRKKIDGIIKQSSSKLPTGREELAKTIPIWMSVVARWLGKTPSLTAGHGVPLEDMFTSLPKRWSGQTPSLGKAKRSFHLISRCACVQTFSYQPTLIKSCRFSIFDFQPFFWSTLMIAVKNTFQWDPIGTFVFTWLSSSTGFLLGASFHFLGLATRANCLAQNNLDWLEKGRPKSAAGKMRWKYIAYINQAPWKRLDIHLNPGV